MPTPTPRAWPLHILALGGFVVAQPLYDILRRFGPFLVAHFSQAADILLLALFLSVALPLALATPALVVAAASRRLGWWLQLATVGVFFLLLGLALARRFSPLAALEIWIALAVALPGLELYRRSARLRRALAWLALPAAVFPLLFVGRAPVRSLVFPAATVPGVSLARPADTPIFLLVLDEFPLFALLDGEEEIDRERFPNIAALAADATWFRNATTVAQSTAYGVPAILSGRYPFKDVLLPVAEDYRSNLFTLLGGDYNLNVMETGTRMCPLDLCTGAVVRPALGERMKRLLVDLGAVYLHVVAPQELAAKLPDIGAGWQGYWEAPRPRRKLGKADYVEAKAVRQFRWNNPRATVEEFLASIERFPRPTLHYLHVLLPHTPWNNLPDGHSYDPEGAPGYGERYWSGTEWQLAQGLQRHLLQVGFVDRVIGRFRAVLEKAGIYDESLIILVSDHGAGFRLGEGRRWLLPEPGANLSDLANVPLIVKFPGQGSRGVDDRNAETIDVLPTILDHLDLDHGGLDGASLARPDAGRERKTIYPTRGNKSARGVPVRLDVASLAGRRDMIRFKQRFVGHGAWATVYALGPLGGLVGTRADTLGGRPLADVSLDRAADLRAVDLDEELLPLWLAGSLGEWRKERWVALALNGIVAATTETYDQDGSERFAALLAPRTLRAGDNSVEVYALPREPAP